VQHKYHTPVADIWSLERKMKVWTTIELLNLECWDRKIGEEASKALTPTPFNPNLWLGIAQQMEIGEEKRGHEVEAYIDVLNGYYQTGLWHKGLASSDLVECWLADCIKRSREFIWEAQERLSKALTKLRECEGANALETGITHGQVAEPMTWGWRIDNWRTMLQVGPVMWVPGKVSGAVGTGVVTHPDVAAVVHLALDIDMAAQAGQIVMRNRMTDALNNLSTQVCTVEKIANDLRVLFTGGRIGISNPPVGSSSMPHKVNPYEIERIIGMCKMVTSMIHCVNTTNADNWLERDLVHSSVEREFLPMIFNHAYYAVNRLAEIVDRVELRITGIPDWAWSSIALADRLKHRADRAEERKKSQTTTADERQLYARRVKNAVAGDTKATDG